ncbi:MAG TPA: mechanosensitive ion channel family protein [Anaerolineae bacterium]|nr:mechanosensitive ion channel family protein [Anaerolineae bacterium]
MTGDTSTIGGEINDVAVGFIELYKSFLEKLPEIVLALITVFIFFIIARAIRKTVRKAMARTSTEGHVDILVSQIAYIGTLTVGIIIALISLDIELTALFTSLGVAGFAVGFAMKDILGNFLSGIILLTQRPFTIGDRVVIGDVEGIVTNIRIRDTQITTYDGRLVYIPNNTLSTSNIINLTAFPERRTDIDIGISYGSDIAKASKICLDAVSDINGVVKEPAAEVLVTGFADSAIMLQVRVWVDQKNENYFNVRSEAYRALKEALDDAGIEIPFPVRTVYFHQSGNLEPELEEIVGNHPDTSG